MFLEKLEIQGFKSFAQKNTLIFPGFLDKEKRGITSIVGPNGSGKSNVADAVRWALGEQSMKTLRGKKSEDIIFSGTEKKGKLGMAEVSLFLNNEDGNPPPGGGARRAGEVAALLKTSNNDRLDENNEAENRSSQQSDQSYDNENIENNDATSPAPAGPELPPPGGGFDLNDLSEIVLTRRIYRNGDSEYLLNNSRVRLSDIQMFLAKAKFGQKTYSVIGQGTVEGFLNSSMAERKEFFDEATGVKQFQIKRDEALNKLRTSYENLIQAQMLIAEIEPRLKSLTRQVGRLNKRGELEAELKTLQLGYFSRLWHSINAEFSRYNGELLGLEKEKRDKEKKLEQLSLQMANLEKETLGSGEYEAAQSRIRSLEREKSDLSAKRARLDAQMELRLEADGKFDLAFLMSKKEELRNEAVRVKEEIGVTEESLLPERIKNQQLENEKKHLEKAIFELNQKIRAFAQASMAVPDETADVAEHKKHLHKLLAKIKTIKPLEDLAAIRTLLDEIEGELLAIIEARAEKAEPREKQANHDWELWHKELDRLAQKKEEISRLQYENFQALSSQGERIKLLKEKARQTESEVDKIEAKIKQHSGLSDPGDLDKERAILAAELEKTEIALAEQNSQFREYNARQEARRSRIFSVQKDLQAVQNEVNSAAGKLNDIKIASTRYETRLEDLEIEIREDFGDLKAIKDHEPAEAADANTDIEAEKEKIFQIKRQLEQIGGIDPQVEVEYRETKERFDFLSGQVGDFDGAVSSLRKIIKELDLMIKDRFDEEFKVIAKKFEEYFKILFNGGSAKIVKVMESAEEEDDAGAENKEAAEKKSAEEMQLADLKKIKFLQKHNATGLAGVEIQATPPGKKIQSIAMLSGGERALTAIALICAIISANPSPFVVLDEVDAALDEANSERLAKILDELSHKTQFIVITHNRASMRRANILYGVTMGDDGISKLLSIKLDEAAANASR